MNIIITGSSGFIGKYLKKALSLNEDIKIIELSRKKGLDICNWNSFVNVIENVDVVIHLAAKTFVPDSYINPRDFFDININSTINSLEICRQKKAKHIFISSYVYGTPEYQPIDELHPIGDFNPYAKSKIISEEICYSYAKHFGVQSIILRPFNIYGIGQSKSLVMQNILDQLSIGKVLLKDPRPKRDFLHVSDVINAIVSCIYTEFSKNIEIFNIGFGKSYSLKEVLDIFKKYLPSLEYEFTNEIRPNEVLNTQCNIEKAKSILGWKPLISLEEGIKNLLQTLE